MTVKNMEYITKENLQLLCSGCCEHDLHTSKCLKSPRRLYQQD